MTDKVLVEGVKVTRSGSLEVGPGRKKRLGTKLVLSCDLSDPTRSYLSIGRAPIYELIEIVREGVPPALFVKLASDMQMDQKRLSGFLGIPRANLGRKATSGRMLSSPESERVVGVAQLVAEAQRIVDESGDGSTFDAAAWVGRWMEEPLPVLGDRPPSSYMDTVMGQQAVLRVLRMQQSGAYG